MTATAAPIRAPDGSPWGDPLVPPEENPQAVARARKALGFVPNFAGYLCRCPWVFEAMLEMATLRFAFLPGEMRPLCALIVARDNSCRHCYGATRSMLRLLGYSASEIERLETELHLDHFGERERRALQFMRALSRGVPRPTEQLDGLADAGWSREAYAELTFYGAATVFATRVNTIFGMPPDTANERLPDRWYIRALRPLLARLMRHKMKLSEPAAAEPEVDGAFAPWVQALHPSPAAEPFGEICNRAWADGALPKRTKALLLAIVGRALECDASETAARTLLADADFTGSLETVLTHLATPGLSAWEQRLLPFARETVRYRVTSIQSKARSALAGLEPSAVIEAVGVLGLANTLARASIILDRVPA